MYKHIGSMSYEIGVLLSGIRYSEGNYLLRQSYNDGIGVLSLLYRAGRWINYIF